MQESYVIVFMNMTNTPVQISTFIEKKHGICFMNHVTVDTEISRALVSSTGEWYVGYDRMSDLYGYSIGKFRNQPCASGAYSWMDDERFDLVYETGTITLVYK